MNIIKKKKRIMVVCITLLLAVSIYINLTYKNNAQLTGNKDRDENLGGAEYVNGGVNYFSQARLSRKNSRDESIELLNGIINSDNATDEAKEEAARAMSLITVEKDMETTIENLIKSKGFEDCVVFAGEDCINIVVKTPAEGLTQTQAAQIRDIAITENKNPECEIKIIEKK